MTGTIRRYFPGNNTPEGFFSYYHNIQRQSDATRIWYLKGGPGTGKSTFIRRIGEVMCSEGEQIDFLHCSSDSDSLDGVLLKKKGFAIIDGTRPHLIDPSNPGAVDTIVHLGEFWDEKGLLQNKADIIKTTERIKGIYNVAYRYLAAAGEIYDALSYVESQHIGDAQFYEITKEIIDRELPDRKGSTQTGFIRRFFASAVAPKGTVNYIDSLTKGYKKTYLINSYTGSGSYKILNMLLEHVSLSGINSEACYCPMKPRTEVEHLLVPDLSVAFFTSNEYHKISPQDCSGKVTEIDIETLKISEPIGFNGTMADLSRTEMNRLLEDATGCLAEAKKKHDLLESYYIPCMDFEGIERLRGKIESEIRHQ